MSDYDRGAYTPNHDAPLSFDARQQRGRRAFPTTLVISLVILAVLGVAIFMFYRSGVRRAGEPPVAVGAPVGEIKTAPPAAVQPPPDAAQGLQVYKGDAPAAASPPPAAFAPPPEQPQPRPAPTTPVQAQPIAPPRPAPVTSAPIAPSKPAPVAATPAPPAPVAKPPASAKIEAPKAETKPAPKAAKGDAIGDLLNGDKAPAKVAVAPAPASAAHGAALVQFGAFSSSELAASEWAKLAKAYGSAMSGKGRVVEPVSHDGKTLFRGEVSGFVTRADAVAFCAKLKADGKACMVK